MRRGKNKLHTKTLDLHGKIKMIKKIIDYLRFGLMIIGVSIVFIIILPYAFYKSFKHLQKSE